MLARRLKGWGTPPEIASSRAYGACTPTSESRSLRREAVGRANKTNRGPPLCSTYIRQSICTTLIFHFPGDSPCNIRHVDRLLIQISWVLPAELLLFCGPWVLLVALGCAKSRRSTCQRRAPRKKRLDQLIRPRCNKNGGGGG